MVTRKRPPYLRQTRRSNESQVPVRPKSDTPVGWIYSVEQKLRQLYQETEGLALRLGTSYKGGVPACYIGEKLFTPETESFDIVPPYRADNTSGLEPVNYVVRSGQEYSIPLVIDGPGVFAARYLKVTISQRFNFPKEGPNVPGGGAGGVIWFPLPPIDFMNVGLGPLSDLFGGWPLGDGARWSTQKYSIMAGTTIPMLCGVIANNAPANANRFSNSSTNIGINYFWNLIDQDSQRRYSEELISDQALLRQGNTSPVDGNLLKFDTPWLFERAGVVDFKFFPITDVLQLAANATEFPLVATNPAGGNLPINDLEDGGTKRDQSVLVKVELHGTKYYDKWDYIRREAS